MRSWTALITLGLTACGGNGYTYSGSPMKDFFPFDGEERSWELLNTDETVQYKLIGHMIGESELIDGSKVYTVDYNKECYGPDCVDDELVFTLRWSSDSADGVLMHGVDDGSGYQDLSPPVQFALPTMENDDTVESTTGGQTFTSTYNGQVTCPLHMAAEWDCAELAVTSDSPRWPITGTWWAAASKGVVAMELEGDSGRWELSKSDCAGNCDGLW